MPPKKTTPYQLKKGLTYVKHVPRFLQGITSQTNDDDERLQDIDSEEPSDNELNATREEERPQIVVLKEGKHMNEQEVKAYLDSKVKSKEKELEDEEHDIDDDAPVVDEKTGKILFRKPRMKKSGKTTSSETVVGSHSKSKNEPIKAINEVIDSMKRKRDNEIENGKSEKNTKKSKKKSQQMKSHLSFNDDEI